jgi:hypothetical protein
MPGFKLAVLFRSGIYANEFCILPARFTWRRFLAPAFMPGFKLAVLFRSGIYANEFCILPARFTWRCSLAPAFMPGCEFFGPAFMPVSFASFQPGLPGDAF